MKKKLLFAALAAVLATASNAQNLNRQITVQGSAKLVSATTHAFVQAGAVTKGKTAKEAMDLNAAIMNKVFAGLKEVGVEAKDMASTTLQLTPVMEYNSKNVPRVVGYDSTHLLSITFRDIAKLGDGLDKLVAAGANTIGQVTLQATESEERKDAARIKAVEDAKRRAELLVKAGGAKIGRLIAVQETSQQHHPRPMMVQAKMAMDSASTPIAAGEQSEVVNVQVTFEIVD